MSKSLPAGRQANAKGMSSYKSRRAFTVELWNLTFDIEVWWD